MPYDLTNHATSTHLHTYLARSLLQGGKKISLQMLGVNMVPPFLRYDIICSSAFCAGLFQRKDRTPRPILVTYAVLLLRTLVSNACSIACSAGIDLATRLLVPDGHSSPPFLRGVHTTYKEVPHTNHVPQPHILQSKYTVTRICR